MLSAKTTHRFAWLIAIPIAGLAIVPLAVVTFSLASPDPAIWAHLEAHVLPGLLRNTAWLVAGVGIGVALLGGSLAWLTGACDFPGRRFFDWALLLPLALPAYVSAFVWLGVADYAGSLASLLRETGLIQGGLPIRSLPGLVGVLSLALFPYVFLPARVAFHDQGRRLIEAAQSLGFSRWQAFFRVALPMARPALVAGVLLAWMETLADFGTVAIFNIDTFTTAIYKSWFSLFSLPTAAQLACLLLGFVLTILLLENLWRSRDGGGLRGRVSAGGGRIVLKGAAGVLAGVYAAFVFALAFLLPFAQVLWWAGQSLWRDWDERYLDFIRHSLLLAGGGAVLVVAAALLLAYAQRLQTGWPIRLLARMGTLGYAVPGAVLAVGFVIPLAGLDNWLIAVGQQWLGQSWGPVLQGSVLVMLLAYLVRFLAVGVHPLEAGLARITLSVDEAAQSLGLGAVQRLWRVHIPILRGSLFSAAALVFVDIMKELPLTLMTRPFGWDTLAVRVFEMTSEGEWERAALPAAVIVLVGLLPVILLIRRSEHAGKHAGN